MYLPPPPLKCINSPKFSKSFTLSEVLITLGVIGIMAALTLPTVISKYKRKSVETKLAKFYSVMNEAVKMSIAEHGEIEFDTAHRESINNAEYIEQWYKENLTKYIKTLKWEGADKSNQYFRAVFADGTSFSSYLSGGQDFVISALWIFYCTGDYKNCKKDGFDGESQFLFRYEPNKRMIVPEYEDRPLDVIISSCKQPNKGSRHGCSAWIEQNGWKIPEDYPWIR